VIDRMNAALLKLLRLIIIGFLVVAVFRWASSNPEQFGAIVTKVANAAVQTIGAMADWIAAQTKPS
jgi:uncharacterized membrane-anchored protein YjiN (DUF445 family)